MTAATATLSDVSVLTRRYLRTTLGTKNLFNTVVTPLIFFLAFSLLLRHLLTVRGIDFGQFFPPAIIVMSMGFTAMWTAYYLAQDRKTGLAVRLRTLPIASGAVLTARLAADAVQALGYLLVILVAGWVAGFRFHDGPLDTFGFVAITVGFGIALALGAAALGLRSRDPQAVSSLLFLPFLPLQFFSTAYVPLRDFPGWLQPVVSVSPFTAVIGALRALSTRGLGTAPVWEAVAWTAGLIVVFGLASTRAWRVVR